VSASSFPLASLHPFAPFSVRRLPSSFPPTPPAGFHRPMPASSFSVFWGFQFLLPPLFSSPRPSWRSAVALLFWVLLFRLFGPLFCSVQAAFFFCVNPPSSFSFFFFFLALAVRHQPFCAVLSHGCLRLPFEGLFGSCCHVRSPPAQRSAPPAPLVRLPLFSWFAPTIWHCLFPRRSLSPS